MAISPLSKQLAPEAVTKQRLQPPPPPLLLRPPPRPMARAAAATAAALQSGTIITRSSSPSRPWASSTFQSSISSALLSHTLAQPLLLTLHPFPPATRYALSYVFKGNPSFKLQICGGGGGSGSGSSAGGSGDVLLPDGGKLSFEGPDGARAAVGTFSGLVAGGEYLVVVEEDKKELAKLNASGGAYSAASGKKLGGGGGFGRSVGGGTRGSALVTAELKKLSPEELKEGGAKYRALLEARDLEDALGGNDDAAILGEDSSGCSCIFGNPCAMPHACKDWRNRFEIATKHGWKGF